MNLKRFFGAVAAVLLIPLISCGTTQAVQKAEKAEIKEIDGTFIISNRDSVGNPFLTDKIIIKNKTDYYNMYSDIKLFASGTLKDGTNKTIFQAKSYRHKDTFGNVLYDNAIEYKQGNTYNFSEPSYNLSDFTKIILSTTNCKITKSDIQAKNGSLYVTIKDYDFTQLPKLVEETATKIKSDNEARKRAEDEKQREFYNSVFERGKKLYEEKILSERDRNIPILVKSYKITRDSADGIDVYIDFQNLSDKRIKYVYFEVTPYNTVNDIAYSTLDRSSTKNLEATGYFHPDTTSSYYWKPQWYNPTISYIKINSAKIVFDNGAVEIPKKDIDKILNTKTIEQSSKLENGETLKIKYSLSDNSVKLSYGYTSRKENYNNHTLVCHFDIDTEITSEKEEKSYGENWFGFYSEDDKIYLEKSLSAYTLAAAKSGYIEHTATKFRHEFTEAELQFISDCSCLKYYVKDHQ